MFCQGLFESNDAIANMWITLIGNPENRINTGFFRERDEGSDWFRGDAILHRCAGCWLFKAAPINMNDGGMRNFFPQGRPYRRKGAIHTLGNIENDSEILCIDCDAQNSPGKRGRERSRFFIGLNGGQDEQSNRPINSSAG